MATGIPPETTNRTRMREKKNIREESYKAIVVLGQADDLPPGGKQRGGLFFRRGGEGKGRDEGLLERGYRRTFSPPLSDDWVRFFMTSISTTSSRSSKTPNLRERINTINL